MGAIGKRIFTVAVGLLLAAGVPHVAATTAHADPGSGCGCESDCGHGKGKDGAGHHGMRKGMHGKEGGQMHGMHMEAGGPMKEGMTRHMEEMRATILKLRAIEAKMEALESKGEAAFHEASMEHAKLLTDLQDSHLKHMEGMMGGK